jgi:hypothetical protein
LKLCQKGKWFPVFPTISMQNLVNFEIRKVIDFDFNVQKIENLEKSEKSRAHLSAATAA